MNVVLAVLAVGAASLLFRLAPLLSTRRMPECLTRAAGRSGLAVVAGITVRSVLLHKNSSIPVAPLVATVGLALAYQGRSLLVAVGVAGSAYLMIAAALA